LPNGGGMYQKVRLKQVESRQKPAPHHLPRHLRTKKQSGANQTGRLG